MVPEGPRLRPRSLRPLRLPEHHDGRLRGVRPRAAVRRLTDRGNAEIAELWLLMAIRAGYKAADARLERVLTSIGRRKDLMPLLGELAKTPEGRARAEAIYARARPTCHPIAVDSVDQPLGRK